MQQVQQEPNHWRLGNHSRLHQARLQQQQQQGQQSCRPHHQSQQEAQGAEAGVGNEGCSCEPRWLLLLLLPQLQQQPPQLLLLVATVGGVGGATPCCHNPEHRLTGQLLQPPLLLLRQLRLRGLGQLGLQQLCQLQEVAVPAWAPAPHQKHPCSVVTAEGCCLV